MLDLARTHEPIYDQVMEAVGSVVQRNAFILGDEVSELEQRIATYSQCRYGIGVSSGSDALLVALMALDIGPGDEVITSPFSFFASAGCITRLGATPVFVDIDPVTFNLNPALLEAEITPRTRAIIPAHLYGQMADMPTIMEIADRHGLYVIEDGAQAIGAEHGNGSRVGSMGALGCLSFHPTKNLGGFGDGGMVLT
ncbi:MAG: aminotransferase class V-fold PLP-dependent enzyme, partial [Candidatus Poribacteria bacterium]|nr:aminotransferase class V-fold PLP-dependent enzyme [Candidatus Poribacteria bacterium]